MTEQRFKDEIARLRDHYAGLVRAYGDAPEGAQWRDRATQEQRMVILTEIADLRLAKVLDFGCGTGHLLNVLHRQGFAGEYVGYDLVAEALGVAQTKHPGARFEQRDILRDGMPEQFDYILLNGVFNNAMSDNWGFMTATLRVLFGHVDGGLAFNALSTYIDYFDDGLFYVEPERVFRFCKEELSPRVTLRHDYEVRSGSLPFEFTVYVYPSKTVPRRSLAM